MKENLLLLEDLLEQLKKKIQTYDSSVKKRLF